MSEKLDNSIKIPFKVAARTAKLIGLENFSTEEGAIIELVKNTYDADAKNCIVIFDLKNKKEEQIGKNGEKNIIEKLDKENSCIYIIDNGEGMNDFIIKNQWMTIGTANKLENHLTKKGRVKTGAKGIGRFALNRLGMVTTVSSLPLFLEVNDIINEISNESSEYNECTKIISNDENIIFEWNVNWKDFDKKNATVSDIKATLMSSKDQNLKKNLLTNFSEYKEITDILKNIHFESGTVIEIKKLNDDWNFEKLKKLYNNLEMLLPPEEQRDFNIHFFLLSDLKEFGAVSGAYYDDYDYKVIAKYNYFDDKVLNIEMVRNELDVHSLETDYYEVFSQELMSNSPYRLEDFKKNKIEFELPIEKLISNKVNNDLLERIGKFDFTFYYLKNSISDDNDSDNGKRYPYKMFTSATRKSWLKKFGGVKIFRDDFRIRPYGENGDDWLRLGERQAQSPGGAGQRLGGFRIRPNQIAGTINISRIHNLSFQDKSGREGLIENDEFELFKNIIKEIISIFEKDRNTIMYSLSELSKKKNAEIEKLIKGKETAVRIKKLKDQEEQSQNFVINNDESNSKTFSTEEEEMADAILIYEKESEKKDEELRLLRSLASVGLIVSSFAHELHNLKNRLIPRTKYLEKELKKYLDESLFENKTKYVNPFYMLDLIKQEDLKLQHWLVYSLNTLKRDKRERKNIDLNKYFSDFKSIWKNALEDREITLEINLSNEQKCSVKAFEVDLDCIFNNLLSNSLNALKGVINTEKMIKISCLFVNGNVEIEFSDNGKGLDEKYIDNPNQIFNLFESSKVDQHGNIIGTGLGLSIVKTIISEYNSASIEIVEFTRGLSFKIILKGV
ncbi:sensor histidine kinase [Acinetobacter baumannii]|uniref:sensor histidine kinase n=2 Tax=Acinetobacter baumannii TaxID=470 RepID=UPI00062C95E6|nr:sensor histidine kinase [Acinetobacter baumannii]EHU1298005.1 sensor histidine kinase [Acinetobacter baumannii]KKZ30759.1 ATP-binding protein [Acinetobacter baumannii]TPS29118.1 sensor histidine kinase [Acinetobacter baumannii]